MVLILPLAYAALVLLLAALRPKWGWPRCLLRAAALWGAYAVLATELLSLGEWITRPAVLGAWLVLTLSSLGWTGLKWRRSGHVTLPTPPLAVPRAQRPLAVGIALILATTAVVAWFAPPQTWDSLNYHMARVAHWASDRSVAHFATGIEVQNSRPPGAEFLVLQTYVLAASDRLVNFVQWTAMALTLVAVSELAGQLGAGDRGRWAAAVFAATLPMGIVQSSSTTTDYAVALWVVIAASEVWLIRGEGSSPASLGFLGLASGLGLATKPTAFPYLIPIGLYLAYLLLRERRPPEALRYGVLPLFLVFALNLGHLARNAATYGSPLDPGQVSVHANQLWDLRGVLSNLLRSAALHAGTPSPHINKGIALLVQGVHRAIGLEVNDPRLTAHGVFKVSPPTTNEDLTGNPLHAYLLVALSIYVLVRRGELRAASLRYALIPTFGFVGLSVLFKWQIFASRYHLAAFTLVAPLAGRWMVRLPDRWMVAVVGAMFLASVPWLVSIQSRPLVPQAGSSYVGSILTEPRDELVLANGPNLLDPYRAFAERLAVSDCDRVGISLFGNAAEYPLWAYLGAPRSGTSIDWLVAGTPSARYADPAFQPCAVICEGCAEGQLRGLPRAEERNGFQLYLETSDPPS